MGLFGVGDIFGKSKNWKEKTEQKLRKGYITKIKLPEFETVSQGGASRAAATMVGGLIGFALTSGSITRKREISTTFRMADNGLVIEQGTVNGTDLKIPWESIISIDKSITWFSINLTDGSEILSLPPWGTELDDVIMILNSKACGVVDDGW